MQVTITDMPEFRVAAVRHIGAYEQVSEAFDKLGKIADPAGLHGADTLMLAIYYDDPNSTPAAALRSDAGLTVSANTTIPDGLTEQRLPAGRYATTRHLGPYSSLPATWAALSRDWLPSSGHRRADGPSYEVYRNNPMNAAPADLITDLYVPVI